MTLIGLATTFMALKFGLWSAVAFYVGLTTVFVGILVIKHPPTAFLVGASAMTLGPFCGPVWLLALGVGRPTAQPTPEPSLGAPTHAERIAQDIQQGRRPVKRDKTTPSFIEVFISGSLHEQQSALAAIARHFTPELRPALHSAQASRIPVIRAQAVAVLTQLRDSYTNRARMVLSNATGLNASALMAEIDAISRSGFLDLHTLSELKEIAQSTSAPRNTMVLP
ncbi:hypothetical protein HKX17_16820 [Sulfitobacter sp. KE34]|nr:MULTISPECIES: hypothetical protein [unclassified Sulfitobacter]MDF3377450.1 hypothetical protein [Sulfitobacter sp. KE37]MDF3394983.1 hypothetical protein [Sulfitobacter sp. Ks42]MDF3438598.1 hypothetical protein [Sulfitobacter sp. Ks46]MDF3442230.1 hypothetical protein [Sulfitobacter sp. KE34]MDF3449440.1 hypothetical protein [Sulfitobacter sp. KE26]